METRASVCFLSSLSDFISSMVFTVKRAANKWPSTRILRSECRFREPFVNRVVRLVVVSARGDTLIDNHLLSGRPAVRPLRSAGFCPVLSCSALLLLLFVLPPATLPLGYPSDCLSPYRPFLSNRLFQQRRVRRLKHHLLIFHRRRLPLPFLFACSPSRAHSNLMHARSSI